MRPRRSLRWIAYLALSLNVSCGTSDLPALESVLRTNLRTIRDLIDQYRGDQGTYPPTLAALVDKGYVRLVPYDPLTRRSDTWIEIRASATAGSPPGIVDVHSGAKGTASDGSSYGDW